MERVQEQKNEILNRPRLVPEKFTGQSQGGALANRINNGSAMVAQRQRLNDQFGSSIQCVEFKDGAEDSPGTLQPLQLIRAGVIPQTPNSYRTTTKITANPSFAAIDGAKPFNSTQTTAVRNDNETRSNDVYVRAEDHPLQDDDDDSGLLAQERASRIAPEVDHIVPQTDNGANDMRNARVLSKQNNITSTNRPGEAGKAIAVYENVTINSNNYYAGDKLNLTDTNKVKDVYNARTKKSAVYELDSRTAKTVRRDTI